MVEILTGLTFLQLLGLISIFFIAALILIFVIFKLINKLSRDKNLQLGNFIKLESPKEVPGEIYHNQRTDNKEIHFTKQQLEELIYEFYYDSHFNCHVVQNEIFDTSTFFFNLFEELIGKISDKYENVFEALIFEIINEEEILTPQKNRIMEKELSAFRITLNIVKSKIRLEMTKNHRKVIENMIKKKISTYTQSPGTIADKVITYYKLGVKLRFSSEITTYMTLKEYLDTLDGEIIEDIQRFVRAYSVSVEKSVKAILNIIDSSTEKIKTTIEVLFNEQGKSEISNNDTG